MLLKALRSVHIAMPVEVIDEMRREAKRQERPLAQIAQMAWRIAAPTIKACPTAKELMPEVRPR